MPLINVLDHGFVRLVEFMGSDLSAVRAARVSYDAAWRTGKDEGSDARLIDYLVRNQHTSPLEAVVLTFEVKAPIFVLRQWHRHRTWSYNELSARYRELPEEFYTPDPEYVGLQAVKGKQQRDLVDNPQARQISDAIYSACKNAHRQYRVLLAMGCPRELARGVLPVNTYSHMFATVNLHNLFRFLTLRLHSHAQYEIRVYAEAMLELAEGIAPIAVKSFKKHYLGDSSGKGSNASSGGTPASG